MKSSTKAIASADLTLLIQSDESFPPSLSFTPITADPSLLTSQTFGPVRLRTDPKNYFDQFFRTLENQSAALDLSKNRLDSIPLKKRGLALFEELFPEALQKRLWRIRDRIHTLWLVSDEPWIPWELCALTGNAAGEPDDGPFFCQAFEMTRWFSKADVHSAMPFQKLALVRHGSAGLSQARAEQRDLEKLFASPRTATPLSANLDRIQAAMRDGAFDVWHFIGHGKLHPDDTGPVFELEDLFRLTPDTLSGSEARMGRAHPLVFMNCCYSGRAGRALTGAGGWAKAFAKIGAAAFIGAQWAVPDKAARRFARAFYTALLKGAPFGAAVRSAREATRELGDASWLAFVAYGHPLTRAMSKEELSGMDATQASLSPGLLFLERCRQVRQEDSAAWGDRIAPALAVLAAAREPISSWTLAEFTDMDVGQAEAFAADWLAFLQVDTTGEAECPRYALSHEDLRQSLERAGVDIRDGHRRIVARLQRELAPS